MTETPTPAVLSETAMRRLAELRGEGSTGKCCSPPTCR